MALIRLATTSVQSGRTLIVQTQPKKIGTGLSISHDGVVIDASAVSINFTGDGLTITDDGDGNVTVDITSGGLGGATGTALTSEAISNGKLGNYYSDTGVARAQKADCSAGGDGTGKPANCFIKFGAGSGLEVTVLFAGQLITGIAGLVPGATYYLGLNGALSLTPPAPGISQASQIVGVADETGSNLMFAPQSIFGI